MAKYFPWPLALKECLPKALSLRNATPRNSMSPPSAVVRKTVWLQVWLR